MPDRLYYRENSERLLAQTRAWKEANRDRAREHNRESMRRAAVRKKAVERKRARGRTRYAENPEKERERSRRYRREHPEKQREYQARFRERHPERAAEQDRRAREKWRDANADTAREKARTAAAARRKRDPDAYRRWYHANIEKQREAQRTASRRRSRLKKLGLPPRRIRRVYANERRANDSASEEFFGRRHTAADVQRLRRESGVNSRPPTAAMKARQRIMSGPELHDAAAQLQGRLRAAKARDLARSFYPEVSKRVADRHGDRMRQEIELDSIARGLRGTQPYDVEAELQLRVQQEAHHQVVALAKRSVDENQMKRLLNASFPTPPNTDRRATSGDRAKRPRSQTGRERSATEAER